MNQNEYINTIYQALHDLELYGFQLRDAKRKSNDAGNRQNFFQLNTILNSLYEVKAKTFKILIEKGLVRFKEMIHQNIGNQTFILSVWTSVDGKFEFHKPGLIEETLLRRRRPRKIKGFLSDQGKKPLLPINATVAKLQDFIDRNGNPPLSERELRFTQENIIVKKDSPSK